MPKKGSSQDEYEDAACPAEELELETGQFRCAVADGATEASFADRWARLLVKGFCDGTRISELQPLWKQEIAGLELPWYAQEKAEEGAFAALVGLAISDGDTGSGGTWEAQAVGDSIMLHTRQAELLSSFPLSHPDQFNNSPELVSSNPVNCQAPDAMLTSSAGQWLPGDEFLLLTDAIGGWALARQKNSGDALAVLATIRTQQTLNELVDKERAEKTADGRPNMRNDDVTFLRIELQIKCPAQ
jgi:hypothetical protein